jgi:PAS domain S-box-containing protein
MPDTPIHLLILERNPQEAERLQSVLACLPDMPCEVQWVAEPAAADAHLEAQRAALLLLGLETGRAGADEIILGFREKHPWLAILIVASDRDPAAAERLIRCGAQEVIGQDELLPDLVSRAIRHALARQATELSRRANEELLRLVAENTTDLIAVLDCEGRRLYNNPSYARIFGTPQDIVGTDSFAEIHPEDRDRIRQVFRDTLATGQGQRAEFRLLRPGGEVRRFESVGSVSRDAQGQPDRVIVVSRDLTEKQQLMEGLGRNVAELRVLHGELQSARRRLGETEKLAAVATFAGALAHDVKDKLQTLLLGLDFLRAASMAQDAGAAGVLEEMTDATRNADAAMRSLLEFARFGPATVADHDLNGLVGQCADAVLPEANARRIRVERQLAPRLPGVRADATRLRHVLLKALLDGIQATTPGGQIKIKTSVRGSTASTVMDPASLSSAVLVEIEDASPGSGTGRSGEPDRGTTGQTSRRSPLELATLRSVVEGFGARLEEGRGPHRGGRISLLLQATPAPAPPVSATPPT